MKKISIIFTIILFAVIITEQVLNVLMNLIKYTMLQPEKFLVYFPFVFLLGYGIYNIANLIKGKLS